MLLENCAVLYTVSVDLNVIEYLSHSIRFEYFIEFFSMSKRRDIFFCIIFVLIVTIQVTTEPHKSKGITNKSDEIKGPRTKALPPIDPPTDVRIENSGQHALKVWWKPPVLSGDILGYYVGYKFTNSESPYLFQTIDNLSEKIGNEYFLEIDNLKVHSQYSIIMQAFNKMGAGPLSKVLTQYTAEGIPEEPPIDTICSIITSSLIMVSWAPPPLATVNGIIKGYKVIYGPSVPWNEESTKDNKTVFSTKTSLTNLQKFTNYSIQVLAYTNAGDGVLSDPVYCQTNEDVPDKPSDLKTLTMSSDSVLVSWKPPIQTNGVIIHYTVYFKEVSNDSLKHSQKVLPDKLIHKVTNLNKDTLYEFYVTASTIIGEGEASITLVQSPKKKVSAKIASFDGTYTTIHGTNIELPCFTVGASQSEVTWKFKGNVLETNDHIRQLPDGSLFIEHISSNDNGEYSCFVKNQFGQDSVTHQLNTNGPPLTPEVLVIDRTTNSLTINIQSNSTDTAKLQYYMIYYKPEFGEWENIKLASSVKNYTLDNLWCGTRYQIYVSGYNKFGTGNPSDILEYQTIGSKPTNPEIGNFINTNSNMVTLHMDAWFDGGCPILYFVVEYKKKRQQRWKILSNNVKAPGNFVILDLKPATRYNLRVTAHNIVGFSVGEYEFVTLTVR